MKYAVGAVTGALIIAALWTAVQHRGGHTVTRTVTVTTTSTLGGDNGAMMPADPTMDASCVREPNGIAPVCRQGDYAVSVTIGAPCNNPAYPRPEAWQWVNDVLEVARCTTAYYGH